jgi:glycosyltransferase involved in cell wall biosynthesis
MRHGNESHLAPALTPDVRVAVVIPSYRVRDRIASVIAHIGPEVEAVYVVDDACPEGSGRFVEDNIRDPRIHVLYNDTNRGVGGATLAGMARATADGADVIVKIDGDGQMDPALIPSFVGVIAAGEADYAKGNRFFEAEGIAAMPLGRLIGNAGLSFLAKISTGYWHTFDPTNGYIAIHARLIDLLPIHKISQRYFFETDLLFRLNILTARVVDIPMHSHYAGETSNLKPHREILHFAAAHLRNFGKRVLYNYFIRNFSVASLQLVLGIILTLFGTIYGIAHWGTSTPATAGTVMIAALPIIVGVQLLLAFFSYDIESVPRSTLHLRLKTSVLPRRALAHRDNAPNP